MSVGNENPLPRFYTIDEIGQLLGVSRSTLYEYIRQGRFPRPRQHIGGATYSKEDIDAYFLLAGRWQPDPAVEDSDRAPPPPRKSSRKEEPPAESG